MKKITRKKVFAEIVAAKQCDDEPQRWICCNQSFGKSLDVYKHISQEHRQEIESRTNAGLEETNLKCNSDNFHVREEQEQLESKDCQERNHIQNQRAQQSCSSCNRVDEVGSENGTSRRRKWSYSADDLYPWLPALPCDSIEEKEDDVEVKSPKPGVRGEGRVLLFYKYTELEEPENICAWQRELCRRLGLTGKIRVAREGLNGTVGGPILATQHYMKAVMAHPSFSGMRTEEFKTSEGGRDSFQEGLVVSLHQEIVPMGVDPSMVSYKDAGNHLTPAQFHEEVLNYRRAKETGEEPDKVFIDCRNYYESKIGAFAEAVTPDIRKFSYWPEYVDKNPALFADKTVLMYCTGGIRCERGSAYLRSKGICKDVLQLEGGIHRYLDLYPDGFFRGKLFVFDNRYSIETNQDVIAECFHCSSPWDQYQPCTSDHCHQLVLSCPECRAASLTTCCKRCAELAAEYASTREDDGKARKKRREECSCTKNRERIPIEKKQDSIVANV